MSLAAGTKLGPYEIQSPLGAGGMGEVYRARDTRLDRTVAIKILPSHLSGDAEAKQRFDREARAISSLNHANICTLHDVGHQDGVDYLVMEFLEGETLADRLLKGPLPTEQVLRYGAEICEGLERAHKTGVIHRDLKPGNVMLTKSGAKLMDFGLAKSAVAAVTASSLSGVTFAPDKPLTSAGTVVGTFQYMSPEQVEGKDADARSDIFALGAVLYEMATGKRAFEGKTTASVIAAVLERDPDPISAVRPMSPPALDRPVKACVAKDPDERIQTVHDVKLQLKWIAEGPQSGVGVPPFAQRTRSGWGTQQWFHRLGWVAAAIFAVAALALGLIHFGSPSMPRQSTRSSILPPEKSEFLFSNERGTIALSPDGRRLAFTAHLPDQRDMLWVQPLNSLTAQPLAETDDAAFPFWSPDSRYIAFFAGSKLKKIDANGGSPQALAEAQAGRGGAWSADGTILFSPNTGAPLERVSANGGDTVEVTQLSSERSENSHRWPQFLPDGKHYLYFIRSDRPENSGVFVGSLDSLKPKDPRLLFHSAWPAFYVGARGGGYLLFPHDNTLVAQPFDASKLALSGDPRPLSEQLTQNAGSAYSVFSASDTGELVLNAQGGVAGESQLTWYDRAGKAQGLLGAPGVDLHPAFSPDGSRLALSIFQSHGTADVWVLDLARDTRTRITFGPANQDNPVWTHDGKFLYYSSQRGAWRAIYRRAADGSGNEEAITEKAAGQDSPLFVAPDNSYLAFTRNEGRGQHVWMLPLSAKQKPDDTKPIPTDDPHSPFAQFTPSISPDGKWIAYSSSESGPYEIYIHPFPSGPGKWQVSTTGGTTSVWSGNGKELFFYNLNHQIMAVDVAAENGALRLGGLICSLATPRHSATGKARSR